MDSIDALGLSLNMSSVCSQNAIFSKTKKFRAMVSILTTYRKLCNWAFQRTHYWIPKVQDGWDPPSWKLTWRHFFCRGWSDLDKISETGAEWHVDCGDVVEIETRCRIPIWRACGWISWHFIQEPRITLRDIAGCCHLVNSLSRSCHIAGCKNSIRRILKIVLRHILLFFFVFVAV